MALLSTPRRRWSRILGPAAGGVSRARRLLGPGALGLAGVAAVVLVAAVSPEQPGHYPVCPTLALTGFYCPACGGLRAVHALTHGDLGLALQRNPVVVLGLPFAAWAYLAWFRRRWRGRPAAWYPTGGQVAWFLVAFIGFGVVRNLPWFGWLAP